MYFLMSVGLVIHAIICGRYFVGFYMGFIDIAELFEYRIVAQLHYGFVPAIW